MTEQRINKIKRRLQNARYQMVNKSRGHAKLGAPLYSMTFVAVENIYRISTNGKCIFFDAGWLQRLGDTELEFILAHQLMHIKKGHIKRPCIYKGDKFHLGCDIIANANLIDMGYKYEKLNGIGKIHYETYFPHRYYGSSVKPQEAFKLIPFDPSSLPQSKRRQYMIDSEEYWDKSDDMGESGIIILSPDEKDPDDLKLSKTVSQIIKEHSDYEIVEFTKNNARKDATKRDNDIQNNSKDWTKKLSSQLYDLRKHKISTKQNVMFDESFWDILRAPQLNWREILRQFLQENVYDYSFTPYDKRYIDSDFFLPCYNCDEHSSKDIIFMIDTSGSIQYDTLKTVCAELYYATEQFDGKYKGLLGFFDIEVKGNLIPFSDADDLTSIKISGGGGTNFCSIFDYVKDKYVTDNIASIIIFTDGDGKYPNGNPLADIPTLWIITNTDALPPFGTIARIDD